jgi:hypothetical protein
MLNNERKKVWSQTFERGVKEVDAAVSNMAKELNISETPTFDAWTYSNIK